MLTREEFEAIKTALDAVQYNLKTCGVCGSVQRLMQEAEAVTLRPMSEAPKDGTLFDWFHPKGYRVADCDTGKHGIVYGPDENSVIRDYDEEGTLEKSHWLPVQERES